MTSPPQAGCSCSTCRSARHDLWRLLRPGRNEGFDEVTAGIAERFGSAEISRIAFHEGGIEFVFSDQEAEFVAESGLTVG